jgi:nucleoside-diphosphate-sugar epimerase
MARVLIVGCGCRGRALAAGLAQRGLAVRGTTRDPACTAEIKAAGAEAVVADPDRLGTLLPHLDGVTVVAWLLGNVPVPPLHDERLRSLLEKLVDTPVRGFVYEDGGGARIVQRAEATFRLPVAVVGEDPADVERWLGAMMSATESLLVA